MTQTAITAKIDTDVYRATKAAAAMKDRSMAQWIEDALRKALPPEFRKGLKA